MAKPPRATSAPTPQQTERATLPIAISLASLVLFLVLAIGDIRSTSPTSDEGVHLAAGWSYLKSGDYRLNTEHPPLLKKLAALPLVARGIWPVSLVTDDVNPVTFAFLREAWIMSASQPTAQWHFANQLFYGLRDATLARAGWRPLALPSTARLGSSDYINPAGELFETARLTMLLAAVLLALVIFLWSRELWGWWGAAVSAVLFCADPNFVAHAGLVTSDVGLALFCVATVWFLWRAMRRFTWPDAALFAFSFALAQVTKFTAVLLLPVVLILAVHSRRKLRNAVVLLAMAGVASVVVIWASYGFRYSAIVDPERHVLEESAVRAAPQNGGFSVEGTVPTGHLRIRSTLEQAAATKKLIPLYGGEPPFAHVSQAMRGVSLPASSRFILFLNDHHLLPEAYLDGLAAVSLDGLLRNSYLNGEYGNRGFPSYFLWTTLFKTPIPLMLLIAAGLLLAFRSAGKGRAFIFWPVAVYFAAASASAVHIGHRHVLPVFPFIYVACGSLAAVVRSRPRLTFAALPLLALPLFLVLPNAPMWGHHLSYMNELAGGPGNGGAHLVDSNLDWGQDLPSLARWIRANHVEEPISLVYFGNADPQYYGIRYVNAFPGYFARPQTPPAEFVPRGIVAISANSYNGFWFGPEWRHYWSRLLAEKGATRIGSAGYSIYLYRFR